LAVVCWWEDSAGRWPWLCLWYFTGAELRLPFTVAPGTRAGGGAPVMESRPSTLKTCGFGVRTSLEATTG